MKKIKLVIGWLMGVILILGAVGHINSPEVSSGFIPDFLPKQLVHIAAAIVEAALGIGVFIKPYRKKALYGIFILMILFLPLHVIDLFRETPIIGSQTAAIIRVLVQFVFIFLAWFSNKE